MSIRAKLNGFNAKAISVVMLACAFCCALLACMFAFTAPAYASSVDTAYSRSAAAVKAYATADGYSSAKHATYFTNAAGCSVIKVDVSDLGLTKKQKQQVMDHVYYNSDNWYIDAIGDGKFTANELVYTCLYPDAEIPALKQKLAAATAECMKLCKGAPAKEKVHMIHDWIIKKRGVASKTHRKGTESDKYAYTNLTLKDKLAYNPIVTGRGDCSGYAYAFDYLARKAGLQTAWAINMHFNDGEGHIWNMVKCGTKWYYVDVTWGGTYTCSDTVPYWQTEICHRYLMLSDYALEDGDHDSKGKWTVLRDGVPVSLRATGESFDGRLNSAWLSECAKTLAVGKTFSRSGLKYRVTSKNATVKVVGVTSKTKSTYAVPKTVWYRGHLFRVTKIAPKAFSKCTKATSLKVGENVKVIGSRAFYGCSSLKKITLKTALLTKKGVYKSLVGSKVSKVVLSGSKAKSKKSKYKTYFKKSNSGRKVSVRNA